MRTHDRERVADTLEGRRVDISTRMRSSVEGRKDDEFVRMKTCLSTKGIGAARGKSNVQEIDVKGKREKV